MDQAGQTQQVKIDGVEVKAPPPTADIFVSYAGDAGEWTQKLTQMLQRLGSQVDSAQIGAWGIKQERKRARLARGYAALVVLLTPEYVASSEAGIDTSPFMAPEQGALKLYAIHLKNAPWQELPWMAHFHVLPTGGWALQDTNAPESMLADIAVTIRAQVDASSAAEAPDGPAPPDPAAQEISAVTYFTERFKLGETVAGMLAHAAVETLQHEHALLDTATLFDSIASEGHADVEPRWTSDWLQRHAQGAVLAVRLRRRIGIGGESVVALKPPVSRGTTQAFESAARIAQRTSGAPEIRTRHLLAALLTDDRGEHSRLLQLLHQAGIDVPALLEDFYGFVRGDDDNDEEWARILLGGVNGTRLLARFDADDSRSEDYLEVRPDVLAFAGLIAARTLTPPLSIGLFGEWGSGKTFFMRMLRAEVDRLARQADASGRMQRDLPFWKRIIQIEFNAWHYVEGNLWASLVQHIFDNLRFGGNPPDSISEELQRHLLTELKTETQAEQQAKRETEQAERLVRQARDEVSRARQAYDTKARELATLSRRNLLADVPVPEIRKEVDGALKALGLDSVGGSALELRTALGEARTLLGRGREVAAPLLHGDERGRRWWFLVMALFAGPAVAVALRVLLEGIGPEGLDTIGAWSAGVATFLSSVAAWIRAQLTKAGEWIQQVEDAQRRLDETIAREQAQFAQLMREAEERLRLNEADYQAARRREEEAQRRVAEAQQRLREASLAGVLSSFIEDRASSTDYRKHLGTLALVRNDFERLSDLIEAENWRLSPSVAGEDTARRGPAKFDTLEDEQRDRARRINRIVLYIDDLDRCPPAKVVEVLQAVHLLLAFPLFVVVVGVDARWITRSLEARYRELLSVDRRAGEPDEFRELFGSATAHDYLEKIFQVPFWLRPMNDAGARAMVGGLLAPSLAVPPKIEPSSSSTDVVQEKQGASGAGEREGLRLPVLGSIGAPEDIGVDMPAEVTQTEVPTKREEPELTAESLEITEPELRFMNELAPLLGRSPRALKRFVNVYRLIKVGLPLHERRAFLRDDRGASDYQAVLFLLAVDTGVPHIASRLFQAFTAILSPDGSGEAGGEEQVELVISEIEEELGENADWWRVRGWLEIEPRRYRLKPRAMAAIARWVPRISRFSFHTGRVPFTGHVPDAGALPAG